MNRSNSTTALFAIVTIACFVNATQSIGDRFSRYMHLEIGENYSRSILFVATLPHGRLGDSNAVQVLYRFGTKSLAVDCSSARCLVVLSNAGEA